MCYSNRSQNLCVPENVGFYINGDTGQQNTDQATTLCSVCTTMSHT